MDATQEQWRPVIGYEELYEVSSLGRVRSLDRIYRCSDGVVKRWRGRMMKYATSDGYLRVNLSKEATQKSCKVHILVLSAFRGPKPFPKACARHLNDIRTDNRIENLAWGTIAENNLDIIRNGNHWLQGNTHCQHGHEYTPDNTVFFGSHRNCRTCRLARDARKRAKKRLQRSQSGS